MVAVQSSRDLCEMPSDAFTELPATEGDWSAAAAGTRLGAAVSAGLLTSLPRTIPEEAEPASTDAVAPPAAAPPAQERGSAAAQDRGSAAAQERGKSAAQERGKSAAHERGGAGGGRGRDAALAAMQATMTPSLQDSLDRVMRTGQFSSVEL